MTGERNFPSVSVDLVKRIIKLYRVKTSGRDTLTPEEAVRILEEDVFRGQTSETPLASTLEAKTEPPIKARSQPEPSQPLTQDQTSALVKELTQDPQYLHMAYGKFTQIMHGDFRHYIPIGDIYAHPTISSDSHFSNLYSRFDKQIKEANERIAKISKGSLFIRKKTRAEKLLALEKELTTLKTKRDSEVKGKIQELTSKDNWSAYDTSFGFYHLSGLMRGSESSSLKPEHKQYCMTGEDDNYMDKNNFSGIVRGIQYGESYIFTLTFGNRTYDKRDGNNAVYGLAIPKDKIQEIVPKIAANPEILVETFKTIFPDLDVPSVYKKQKQGTRRCGVLSIRDGYPLEQLAPLSICHERTKIQKV